jgi:hypothetical protein
MVKVGGSIFLSNPSNNLCGHGFYQFSPELMFRIFTAENGFEVRRIALAEAEFPGVQATPHMEAYEVADPAKVRSRVGLMSARAASILVEAKKIADVPLFAKFPIQSDYAVMWQDGKTGPAGWKQKLKALSKKLPPSWQGRLYGCYEKFKFSFFNRRYYKKM